MGADVLRGNSAIRKAEPGEEADPVWEAMASHVRRTGTGPTRLAEWLPAKPGPVLVQNRGGAEERAPKQGREWTWLETLVLAAYALVAGIGIAWHEPWADESQAWLMARDSHWWAMMWHGVRYEGSPGLWHSILWALARMHVGFVGMHWVAGAIALAGVVVLLRYAPFPLPLRVLLPFGFWLAYQDAVVARSYVVFAVLAFSAATVLRGLAETPVGRKWPQWKLLSLALLLGLMANLSVYSLVASVGFAMAALAVARKRRRAGGAATRLSYAVCLVCAFWAFAAATAVPPSDVSFAAGKNSEHSQQKLLAAVNDQSAKAALTEERANPQDVRPGEMKPVPPIDVEWSRRTQLWHRAARILSLLTYPVSNFRVLALTTCGLVLILALWRKQTGDAAARAGQIGVVGLLPWALMVLVFITVYLAPRHAGMLWTALIASLWLIWPAESRRTTASTRWVANVTMAALILVAADQAWWTAHTVWADVHGPYSGDRAMADFLKYEGQGKRVAGFYYDSVGPVAWFHHKVYDNEPQAYWVWSRNVRTVQHANETIATHPDVIVVGGMERNQRGSNITDDWLPPDPNDRELVALGDNYQIISYAEAHGYRETHRFCGYAFIRDSWAEELCQVALQPVGARTEPQKAWSDRQEWEGPGIP